jgi:antitoxin HigA-1
MPTKSPSRTTTGAKRPVDVPSLAQLRQAPTHPGEMFEEEFRKPSGISQAEAARRMGMSLARMNEIAKGKRAVTAETALLFEAMTGASAEFWLNLQARHDLWHAMRETPAKLAGDPIGARS